MNFKQSDRAAMMEVKTFLDGHFHMLINVRTLSLQAGVSPIKLQIAFRKMFDCPVYTYLTHLRMRKAVELLIRSDLSIKEIAVACGYNNNSDFTKLFKKYHSQSPKNYRISRSIPEMVE